MMAQKIGSINTVYVIEKDIDIIFHDLCYDGRKIVIVTNAELIKSDNVSVIDNRNDPSFKHFLEGIT